MEIMNIRTVPRTRPKSLQVKLPISAFRTLPIPGLENARIGACFIKVTDIPSSLDRYMEINPRVPSRTTKGVLAGPVAKGILETLRERPEEMVLKNQGMYVLVDSMRFVTTQSADNLNSQAGELVLNLTDVTKHGIVNGGHTYAAIREAIETATSEELLELQRAYVRLNVYSGIGAEHVPEIAEGLNRSKQVDDPSLANLQGNFEAIRTALKGHAGERAISYHQGDEGDVYISEVLVYLEMFNVARFNELKHPNSLYNRQSLALKYFAEDMQAQPELLKQLINMLPQFLELGDCIRKLVPASSNKNALQFGRIKVGGERAGSRRATPVYLPFVSETSNYRVPNGWVYPMLAAFRANLMLRNNRLEWRMPVQELLSKVIDALVAVCVTAHRDNNSRPDLIGKRESAYAQCYTKVELFLARRALQS